jgi:hypothetical protein
MNGAERNGNLLWEHGILSWSGKLTEIADCSWPFSIAIDSSQFVDLYCRRALWANWELSRVGTHTPRRNRAAQVRAVVRL